MPNKCYYVNSSMDFKRKPKYFSKSTGDPYDLAFSSFLLSTFIILVGVRKAVYTRLWLLTISGCSPSSTAQ